MEGGVRQRVHDHSNAPPNLVLWVQSVTRSMVDSEGWFYAGRLGSELKIGITKRCPFCRMNHQSLTPLGLAFSDDCKKHEAAMKRALGKPSHGAEFFSDCDERFSWLVSRGYINTLWSIASTLALRDG
ncbi:GIY-YIG nuclease family protein [bacterium]|nr:GIY-YIG nuclease family protein [bacterium]